MSTGGVKTAESLKAFTDGKTSIFSVPLEGKEDIFRDDFAKTKNQLYGFTGSEGRRWSDSADDCEQ